MYLWVDLWDKRCWVSVYINGIVLPKGIIDRVKIINVFKKYIIDYNIKYIIVWMPYDLYNKDNKQKDKTLKFIEKLKIIFPDIVIDFFDERYTSFEADMIIWNYKRDKNNKRDDISAVIILESYLKSKNII